METYGTDLTGLVDPDLESQKISPSERIEKNQ
jgi:hypothetical protein